MNEKYVRKVIKFNLLDINVQNIERTIDALNLKQKYNAILQVSIFLVYGLNVG